MSTTLPPFHPKKILRGFGYQPNHFIPPIPKTTDLSSTITPKTTSPQLQCPLFSKLSLDLRLIIYELVLGDAQRFMHIVPLDFESHHVGHRRCLYNMDHDEGTNTEPPAELTSSTYPYACTMGIGRGGRNDRVRPKSGKCCKNEYVLQQSGYVVVLPSDQLIALLLTCRKIYTEAIKPLYTSNTFHFIGGSAVLALATFLPRQHWDAIRHIHLSTSFLGPLVRDGAELTKWYYPPGQISRWEKTWSVISSMRGLRSLRVDMIILDGTYRLTESEDVMYDERLILAIFTPLRDITVYVFEVEMNIELPESFREGLRHIGFRTVSGRLNDEGAHEIRAWIET